MSLLSKIFGNTRKPEGFFGKMMVNGMNGSSHEKLARWGLQHITLTGNETVLDCGCGGGANVKRLLQKVPNGKVYGIDYSAVSVEKSNEVNEKDIAAKRCKIIEGNIVEMPFEDEQFEVVTAFETVYFWRPIEDCFKEVNRVLKSGGCFMITNESNGKNEKSLKWTQIIDGMTVYTAEQLKALLTNTGFSIKEADDDNDNDRLCIIAVKE